MATKWEYKRGLDLDNEQMNNLGNDGWELVNVFPTTTKVRGSDVRGPSFPAHVPPGMDSTTIVSFWKRSKP
ncbi:MAG TPA: hypothetical protein VNO30_18335 [Kofleriaceae bacterium]|jgi:hypothetical protein|nr:hypothetical protein [Kofleriaceae bacterium]